MKKNRVKIFMICLVVFIIGSGIYFIPNISKADDKEKTSTVEEYVQRGNLEITSSASGTTTAGTDYEYLDISISPDILLEVEELYTETGAEVTTQSPILKVTKSSYDTTKANLEKTLKQAETALQEAKITYKTDLLTLKSKYTSNLSTGEIAGESYENTLENLDLQIEQAKEEYEEAQSIISQYPSQIANNEKKKNQKEETWSKLKTQLEKAAKKEEAASKEYEQAMTVFENTAKKKEEIEIVNNYINSYQGIENSGNQSRQNGGIEAEEQVTYIENNSINNQSIEKERKEETSISQNCDLQIFMKKVNSDRKERELSYQTAQKDYTTKKAALEKCQQTVEKKETSIETKEKEIETLEQTIEKEKEELANAKKQVSSLQITYEQAVSNREKQSITEKKKLEQNLLTSQGAEVSYEIELAELEKTLDAAKEHYEEAKDTWKIFKNSFKNYTWYAKANGTLNYIGYEKGDYITNMKPILGYYNGDTISIEITIDQSERPALLVGDEVTVVTSSMPRGTNGVISMIANKNNSASASKVTYGVTVSIDNTQGNIGAGEYATVTFASNTLEDVLYIPQRLVQSDERGSYVTIKEESGATREVEIITGLETGTFVEIKDGLAEGDCCVAANTTEVHKNVK